MLWFDNKKDSLLEEKLDKAINHFIRKYGKSPTSCYMHPSTMVGANDSYKGVKLVRSNLVLPHHFWLKIY